MNHIVRMAAVGATAWASLALASPAAAAVLSFDFTGAVLNGVDMFASTGDAIRGTFTIDTGATPVSVQDLGTIDRAAYDLGTASLSYTVNGRTIVLDPAAYTVENDRDGGTDTFSVTAPTVNLAFTVTDETGALVSGIGAPTGFPPLDDRTYADFGVDVGEARLTATITAITPSMFGPVPEPSSWALLTLGFGLAGTALRRRRAPVPA